MARYEYYVKISGGAGEDGLGLILGASQFKFVEDTTVEYDEFRKKTLLATDSEIAMLKEERGPESVHRSSPQHASLESRRRPQSSFLQRQSQSSPIIPHSRNRRSNLTSQSGRPAAGYLTPRQQTSGASPGSFNSYEGQDADLNVEPDDDEAREHDTYEENDLDDDDYHG